MLTGGSDTTADDALSPAASRRPRRTQLLFVHGMGRSPISGWPVLWRLRAAGLTTATFGYAVSLENFASIRTRLVARLSALAEQGDYAVVGHSLGGVLLRSALNALPRDTRRPLRLFLLGSPQQPSRMALHLQSNWLFRRLTGDCGHLLGSIARMSEIGAVGVPVTSIVGVRSLMVTSSLFGGEPNDGVVSVAETGAEWIDDQVLVPVVHTLLPSSTCVADIIIDRIRGGRPRP